MRKEKIEMPLVSDYDLRTGTVLALEFVIKAQSFIGMDSDIVDSKFKELAQNMMNECENDTQRAIAKFVPQALAFAIASIIQDRENKASYKSHLN